MRPESEFEAHWLHLYYNYCELTSSLGVKLAHNEKYHSLTSYVKHHCKIQISLSPRSLGICILFMMITNIRDNSYVQDYNDDEDYSQLLLSFLHSQIHFKWISKMIP